MLRIGMSALVLAVGLAVSACAERSAAEREPVSRVSMDIAGLYDVKTVHWNGRERTNQLLVRPLIDQTAWQIVDTHRPRHSLALVSGDVLGNAYTPQSRPSDHMAYFGVAIFEMDGTTWRGRWLSSQSPATVRTVTLSCSEDIIGECTVLEGGGPAGEAADKGSIVIKPSHAGFWLKWLGTEHQTFGVALVQDDKLIVSFGRDIFPAIQTCRIRGTALDCVSSQGDLSEIDRGYAIRRSATPSQGEAL
jgi:hypothetical protein